MNYHSNKVMSCFDMFEGFIWVLAQVRFSQKWRMKMIKVGVKDVLMVEQVFTQLLTSKVFEDSQSDEVMHSLIFLFFPLVVPWIIHSSSHASCPFEQQQYPNRLNICTLNILLVVFFRVCLSSILYVYFHVHSLQLTSNKTLCMQKKNAFLSRSPQNFPFIYCYRPCIHTRPLGSIHNISPFLSFFLF